MQIGSKKSVLVLPVQNTQSRAYRYVKDAILNLEIPPHAPLRTEAFAREIGVSRTPVREALSRLEQEGLVVRRGGWGYAVRAISLKEAMDLYKVREALEVAAVREAIPLVSKTAIAHMKSSLAAAGEEIRRGRLKQFRDNTRSFYAQIAEATGNACLQSMLGQIDDRIRLLGALMAHMHIARPSESLLENRRVLAAIEKRDIGAAEAAVRRHVATARETLLRHLTQHHEAMAAY